MSWLSEHVQYFRNVFALVIKPSSPLSFYLAYSPSRAHLLRRMHYVADKGVRICRTEFTFFEGNSKKCCRKTVRRFDLQSQSCWLLQYRGGGGNSGTRLSNPFCMFRGFLSILRAHMKPVQTQHDDDTANGTTPMSTTRVLIYLPPV